MKARILLLLALFSNSLSAQDLIISKDSLGPLSLKSEDLISVDLVKRMFPDFKVGYRVGSWEGPDYHSISVVNNHGIHLFSIISYFNEKEYEKSKKSKKFLIDKIRIFDQRGIVDEYGIKVGDSLEKVFKIRGDNLNLIANHFDNSIGSNNIYYVFEIEPTIEEIENQYGINYKDPSSITIEEAKVKKPFINEIEWVRNR